MTPASKNVGGQVLPAGVQPLRPDDPTAIGGHRLAGRLASGRMRVVYLARDEHGGLVAVKTSRTGDGRAEVRRRLRREAACLQRLPAACTPRLLVDGTRQAPPFLVSEYVEGPVLRDLVEGHGPLGAGPVQALAAASARALVLVHDAGIAHCDLRPGNVLLAEDGPRLMDFGVAEGAGGPGDPAGAVTDDPMRPPPAGSGPSRDVFGWGCLVAFAATGHRRFADADLDAPAALAGELEDVPEPLRALVEAALTDDPAARPTARDLLDGAPRRLPAQGATRPARPETPGGPATDARGVADAPRRPAGPAPRPIAGPVPAANPAARPRPQPAAAFDGADSASSAPPGPPAGPGTGPFAVPPADTEGPAGASAAPGTGARPEAGSFAVPRADGVAGPGGPPSGPNAGPDRREVASDGAVTEVFANPAATFPDAFAPPGDRASRSGDRASRSGDPAAGTATPSPGNATKPPAGKGTAPPSGSTPTGPFDGRATRWPDGPPAPTFSGTAGVSGAEGEADGAAYPGTRPGIRPNAGHGAAATRGPGLPAFHGHEAPPDEHPASFPGLDGGAARESGGPENGPARRPRRGRALIVVSALTLLTGACAAVVAASGPGGPVRGPRPADPGSDAPQASPAHGTHRSTVLRQRGTGSGTPDPAAAADASSAPHASSDGSLGRAGRHRSGGNPGGVSSPPGAPGGSTKPVTTPSPTPSKKPSPSPTPSAS